MAQTSSPFFNIQYGWELGQSGWGDPVNTNMQVMSFLDKGAVDDFVGVLPGSPANGDSVVYTVDNQLYFRIGGSWLFVTPQEGMEINKLSDGTKWQWNGSAWVEITFVKKADLADDSDPLEGAGKVGYKPPTGPGLALKGYLDRNKLFVGDGTEIQGAIDYATSIGGRSVDLIPNTVYSTNSIVLKEGVTLQCDNGYAVSVQHLLAGQARGLPILRCGAISSDFIVVPNTSFDNMIRNVVIDAKAQLSGNALIHQGTVSAQRTGSRVENVLVWKYGTGTGWLIENFHREGSFSNVFVRSGENVSDVLAGDVGFDCQSVDWYGDRLLSGFAKLRSLKFSGGACRFDNIDAWGSQQINAEISGTSSTWNRLQVDTANDRGLLVTNCQNAIFSNFVSLSNEITSGSPTSDVLVSGSTTTNISFVNPQMRGTAGNPNFAFEMSSDCRGMVEVHGGFYSTTYVAPFNPRFKSYANVFGGSFGDRHIRGSIGLPQELNPNNVFSNFTAGAPVGWGLRGSATSTQITTGLPVDGDYLTGVEVTSGAGGVSGIQVIAADATALRGKRIVVKAIVKGDGAAGVNNQRIQIFDDVANTVEVIPNDGVYHLVAASHVVSLTATLLQIRLVAANDTTSGLKLSATDFSIRAE